MSGDIRHEAYRLITTIRCFDVDALRRANEEKRDKLLSLGWTFNGDELDDWVIDFLHRAQREIKATAAIHRDPEKPEW